MSPMTSYRFLNGSASGTVLDFTDDLTDVRLAPLVTPSAAAYPDVRAIADEIETYHLQRWQPKWHLIGDTVEYATLASTPVALFDGWVDIDQSEFAGLGLWELIGKACAIAMAQLRNTPIAPPLMWASTADRDWMLTVHLVAPCLN